MGHLNSALARRGGRVVGTDRRSLSFVHQVPSNGEEYEKDSDDDPNFDAGHNEVTPRCKRNSPTGVHEFCWRRVSSLGQGAGVSVYPARSMLRPKKAPPCRRARLRLGALDIRGRCGLPHESKFGVKRLVPEEGPHRDTCLLSHYCIYPQIAHSVPPIARFRFTVPNFPSDLAGAVLNSYPNIDLR